MIFFDWQTRSLHRVGLISYSNVFLHVRHLYRWPTLLFRDLGQDLVYIFHKIRDIGKDLVEIFCDTTVAVTVTGIARADVVVEGNHYVQLPTSLHVLRYSSHPSPQDDSLIAGMLGLMMVATHTGEPVANSSTQNR